MNTNQTVWQTIVDEVVAKSRVPQGYEDEIVEVLKRMDLEKLVSLKWDDLVKEVRQGMEALWWERQVSKDI